MPLLDLSDETISEALAALSERAAAYRRTAKTMEGFDTAKQYHEWAEQAQRAYNEIIQARQV